MKEELLRINTVLVELKAASTAVADREHALFVIVADWLRWQRKYHASTILPFIVRDAIEEQIALIWRRVETARYS